MALSWDMRLVRNFATECRNLATSPDFHISERGGEGTRYPPVRVLQYTHQGIDCNLPRFQGGCTRTVQLCAPFQVLLPFLFLECYAAMYLLGFVSTF